MEAAISISHNPLSASLGLTAILLLIALLAQKAILEASGSSQRKTWVRSLNIAIVPLLLMFGVSFILRMLALLG